MVQHATTQSRQRSGDVLESVGCMKLLRSYKTESMSSSCQHGCVESCRQRSFRFQLKVQPSL